MTTPQTVVQCDGWGCEGESLPPKSATPRLDQTKPNKKWVRIIVYQHCLLVVVESVHKKRASTKIRINEEARILRLRQYWWASCRSSDKSVSIHQEYIDDVCVWSRVQSKIISSLTVQITICNKCQWNRSFHMRCCISLRTTSNDDKHASYDSYCPNQF